VLIERQNSWHCGRTDFKQCISCYNETQLQEFNIITVFVAFLLKGDLEIASLVREAV
jgi:hypothetical protein